MARCLCCILPHALCRLRPRCFCAPSPLVRVSVRSCAANVGRAPRLCPHRHLPRQRTCPRRPPPSRPIDLLAIFALARSFRDIPHVLAASGLPNSFDALLARELNYGAAAPLRDAPTPSPNDARAIVATTTSDAPTPSRALSLALSLSLSLSPATSPTC